MRRYHVLNEGVNPVADTIWQRSESWVGSQIDDSFVMLNIEVGDYVSLNATATDVWN
ncbi:MAG: hypothetical protein RL367_2020, partial [Pseudomonadota bacterium]